MIVVLFRWAPILSLRRRGWGDSVTPGMNSNSVVPHLTHFIKYMQTTHNVCGNNALTSVSRSRSRSDRGYHNDNHHPFIHRFSVSWSRRRCRCILSHFITMQGKSNDLHDDDSIYGRGGGGNGSSICGRWSLDRLYRRTSAFNSQFSCHFGGEIN